MMLASIMPSARNIDEVNFAIQSFSNSTIINNLPLNINRTPPEDY